MSVKGWTAGDVILEYDKARNAKPRQDGFAVIATKLYITREEAMKLVKDARKTMEASR